MKDPLIESLLLRVAALPIEALDAFGAPQTVSVLDAIETRDRAHETRSAALSDALYRAAGPRPEGFVEAERWRGRAAVLALRRDVHNRRRIRPAVWETAAALLSEDLRGALDAWAREGKKRAEACTEAEETYTRDLLAERGALATAASRPGFREGVWLASRSLHEALAKLENRSPPAWRNEETHLATTILAYLARSATKTSPNSLFSATAPAEAGERFAVAGTGDLVRAITRLNVYEARKITACLARDPALAPAIRPRPNPTLRRVGETWTCWRPATLRSEENDEVFLEIGGTPLLDRVLEAACPGTESWPGLVAGLAAETGTALEDLDRFLEAVTAKGILIAEMEVPYNEPRPLAAMARTVRERGLGPAWLPEVEAIEDALDTLSAPGSADRIPVMVGVGQRLAALPHVRPLSENELFRVDAATGFRVTLPRDLLDDVAEGVGLYVRLLSRFYPPPARSDYAAQFLGEFPAGVDVPLLDLYQRVFEPPAIALSGSFPRPREGTDTLSRFRDMLAAGAREGAVEMRLDEGDLRPFLPAGEPPRWMAGALFQLAGSDPHGASRVALNALFHGSGLALSRFHELHGQGGEEGRIARALRRGWSRLVPPGALPAEITYTHWGRTANASLRPRVFDHEIELPGDTASPGTEVLPLADLVIRYDLDRERFTLRSRSRNVAIVPLLSSGVRPEGFVAFLVHLGTQDLMPVAYFPGFDAPGIVRWPRVSVGRMVLFRQRWVFGPDEGPAAFAGGAPHPAGFPWFKATQKWRLAHGLPRRVFVASERESKPFYADLESPLFVELLRRFLHTAPGRVTLTEMLPDREDLWLRDASGRYASEFLIQLSGPRRLSREGCAS